MRRPTAAVGSAVIFLVGPGSVAGLIPWVLTEGWQVRQPCRTGHPCVCSG
jgi:hypothetical protein